MTGEDAGAGGRVAHLFVPLGHHIEEEGIDIVVQRLMVKEKLGEQAQVLAEIASALPVDFEDTDVAAPVDFVARRMHLHEAEEREARKARASNDLIRGGNGEASG